MKKLIMLVCLLTILSTSALPNRVCGKLNCRGASGTAACFYPGEFEKQQAIWMQWPPDEYNAGSRPVYPVMINMIKALNPYN